MEAADGADAGGAGSDSAGVAGGQLGWKPPPAGSPGTASGGPCGGGGARCAPAPPDESPDAFCVYQAGGV